MIKKGCEGDKLQRKSATRPDQLVIRAQSENSLRGKINIKKAMNVKHAFIFFANYSGLH